MKTSTEHITLSPGLDDTELSTECLSTLIDTWPELQTSAVEAVQAPTPNLFSFAETCFFFAVILLNEPSDSGREGAIFKVNDLLEKSEEEEFNRAVNRSVLDARAQSQGGASSSTLVHAGDATNIRGRKFMDVDAEGAGRPFEQVERKPEIYSWQETSRHHVTHTDDTGASDRAPQSPNFNIWDSPVPNPWPDISQGQVRPGVLQGARENSLLPSFSRQFESPTNPFIVHDSSRNRAYSVPHIINTSGQKKAIGIVYLTCTPHDNVPAGEANIGIILTPEARGKGFARQAIDLVLSWVFDEIGFHRVQACILDNDNKDRAISVFTQFGFVHEGIRRRSVYCPNEGVRGTWKDVTYLALLETEWLMRSYLKPAPKNLWEEMFARHAREREELLRWDEKQQKLKRTSSMETVRVLIDTSFESASTTDDESDHPATAPTSDIETFSSMHKGKRRKLDTDVSDRLSRASSPPSSDSEQSNTSWDMGGWESDEASGHKLASYAHISRTLGDAHYLSDSGSSRGSWPPPSAARSSSPSSSNWDLLETSSVSSSSSFESLIDDDDDDE